MSGKKEDSSHITPKTKTPCITVNGEIDNIDDVSYMNGESFKTAVWEFCERLPRFIPVEVKLNDEYIAVISSDNVTVGCQTFSFESIHGLYLEVCKAEQHQKGM